MKGSMSDYAYMNQDSGAVGDIYKSLYRDVAKTTVLDAKTFQFVYIAYLASSGVLEGLNKHVREAKELGATREEIQAVIQAGLSVGGATLATPYRVAMESYDSE